MHKRGWGTVSPLRADSLYAGDMKKLFVNRRIQVRGVTFVSGEGTKAV